MAAARWTKMRHFVLPKSSDLSGTFMCSSSSSRHVTQEHRKKVTSVDCNFKTTLLTCLKVNVICLNTCVCENYIHYFSINKMKRKV